MMSGADIEQVELNLRVDLHKKFNHHSLNDLFSLSY